MEIKTRTSKTTKELSDVIKSYHLTVAMLFEKPAMCVPLTSVDGIGPRNIVHRGRDGFD